MRILLVSHFFPPRYNAGTENYTMGLARAFLSQGHDVQVLCAEDWQTGKSYWNGVTEDTHAGIPVLRVQINWIKASNPNEVLFDSLPVESWLDQFLITNRPDVVHVTSTHSLGVGVMRSVHRAGIPLVLTLMDFWYLCPRTVLLRGDGTLCEGRTTPRECEDCLSMSSRFNQRMGSILPRYIQRSVWHAVTHVPALARLRGARGMALDMTHRKAAMKEALALPNLILSHSGFVKHIFDEILLENRITHLQNGIDILSATHDQSKKPSAVIRFGFIGQITEFKGVHLLIEAFQRLNISRSARLHIWGDLTREPRYVQRLLGLVENEQSITLQGRFERAQLADAMAEIDVLVVPSLWYENAPLVIQEAFALSTPVIATNLGGMAEIVRQGVNGLLFERGNVDDLAKQLRRFIEEKDLLGQLKAGIPKVKTTEEEMTELVNIYQNLITAN